MAERFEIILTTHSDIGRNVDGVAVTVENYNSYISFDEANEYASGHAYSDLWFKTFEDEAEQTAYDQKLKRNLVSAARLIDRYDLPSGSTKTDTEQNLAYPRRGVINPELRHGSFFDTDVFTDGTYGYFDEGQVPQFIKNAVVEEAIDLLVNNRLSGVETSHTSSIGLGGKITLNTDVNVVKTLSDPVELLLENVYAYNRGYGPAY